MSGTGGGGVIIIIHKNRRVEITPDDPMYAELAEKVQSDGATADEIHIPEDED